MKSLDDLDLLVEATSEWLVRAGDALKTFYDPGRRTFIRETVDFNAGNTSTNRAFVALLEFLQFLDEEGLTRKPHEVARVQEIRGILTDIVKLHYAKLLDGPDEVDKIRASLENGVNMFTDSHLLLALAMLSKSGKSLDLLGNSGPDASTLQKLLKAAKKIADQNKKDLYKWGGGKVHAGDNVHDFITLHAVRADDAIAMVNNEETPWEKPLIQRIRRDVLIQLGHHASGITSQFDPAELAFSVALLHRLKAPDHGPLTSRALAVISESQTPDGSWPTSRVISPSGQSLLHVASYEVALALAIILISQIEEGNFEDVDDFEDVDVLFSMLDRTFRLATNTFQIVGDYQGWSNDRTRDPRLVESWATAIVVSFVERYWSALIRYRQVRVLKLYEQVHQPEQSKAYCWPDIAVLLGGARLPQSKKLERISDATAGGNLIQAIETKFVSPVAKSLARRPGSASLLLPGLPGTRKTSLVSALANALGWPLLTLSPPDFLAPGGLEQFEVQAASVFRDLMRLRRVVILFDECEDFFRKRQTAKGDEKLSPASRTISAFITAGMLPRLQRLRERGWVIFALATNEDIENLDPAATRIGRFDFQQPMDNPILKAQIRYIRTKLNDDTPVRRAIEDVLTEWDEGRSEHEHADPVSFGLLDALVKYSSASKKAPSNDELRREIQQLTHPGPPTLST